MVKIIRTVAVAALLAGSTAQAATMTTMSGVVRVNQGSGYQTASGSGPLNPGNMVLVGPGGLAQVSYSCGLTETIAPNAVYTVGDDAKKCAQANLVNRPRPINGPKPMLFHGPPETGGFFAWELAAGVGGVLGTLCLTETWLCEDDKKKKPASP